LLHLSCIFVSGLLVIIQFIPVVRHKWIIVHRLNGYLVLLLFTLSTAGALMIARHAFGGGLDTQAAVGILSIGCIGSFIISYINIKRLQIEQHRAWMLRGWFYVRLSLSYHLPTPLPLSGKKKAILTRVAGWFHHHNPHNPHPLRSRHQLKQLLHISSLRRSVLHS
jgi:hypothetical protein